MYHIVDMPLNKNGDGPETELNKVVRTVYEVWDENFLNLGTFVKRKEAEEYLKMLKNSFISGLEPGD